ncbi:hypothetical protein RFI_23451, partial [Reticulomyxa filosa]
KKKKKKKKLYMFLETPIAKVQSILTERETHHKKEVSQSNNNDLLVEPAEETESSKVSRSNDSFEEDDKVEAESQTRTETQTQTQSQSDSQSLSPKQSKKKHNKKQGGKAKAKKKKQVKKIDAIAEMKRGTAMLKYGRHGFPHFRRFQLSNDLSKLLWFSHKKNIGETSIVIADMKHILEGQQTEVFKQCTQASLEKASFSIVYGTKMKTLDLVAKSHEEAKLWVKGLRGLIKANQIGKLGKVVQILVNVDYVDITKPNYRAEEFSLSFFFFAVFKIVLTDKTYRNKLRGVGFEDKALLQTVEFTLSETKKSFKIVQELMRNTEIQKHQEFLSSQQLVSELEQRFDDIGYSLANQTLDLLELQRDVCLLTIYLF